MLSVRCNLCGHQDTRLLVEKDGFRIVRCRRCGLVYVNPRDDVEEILKIYSRQYFAIEGEGGDGRIGYRNYATDRGLHRAYFSHKLQEISKLVTRGKLLDVGCGLGYFLDEARKSGFDVWGIDVSSYAAGEAGKLVGKDRVHLGTVQDAPLAGQTFSVVTCFQTLEHMTDPMDSLLRMRTLLKSQGLLSLVVPDQGSVLARFMGRAWFGYKPREHLYLFDAKTIRKMLAKVGFAEISLHRDQIRPYPLSYILERVRYLYPKLGRLTQVFEVGLKIVGMGSRKIPVLLGDLSVLARKGGR